LYELLRFEDIKIPELILRQRESIKNILSQVINNLEREEKEHKEKFKNEKLVDLFPHTLSYYISKIYETIYSRQFPKSFGKTHLEYIDETLNKFRQALEKRNSWGAYPGYDNNLQGNKTAIDPITKEYMFLN
jgi:hypothetical protein